LQLILARELEVQYKTAFVAAHTLREAMTFSVNALRISGAGLMAEIDVPISRPCPPRKLEVYRVDRRLAENQSSKCKVVVVMRERSRRALPQVLPAEADAVTAIRRRIARGHCCS
jgi:hypothetical protein